MFPLASADAFQPFISSGLKKQKPGFFAGAAAFPVAFAAGWSTAWLHAARTPSAGNRMTDRRMTPPFRGEPAVDRAERQASRSAGRFLPARTGPRRRRRER